MENKFGEGLGAENEPGEIVPNVEHRRRLEVESDLENIDGEKSKIGVELIDGKPKAVAFFDIDLTLAELRFAHEAAFYALCEKRGIQLENPEEALEIYFKGFKLGNSFREWDRVNGIFVDGKKEWIDPEVYVRDRLEPQRQEIDEAGNEAHERANGYLQEYGKTAAEVLRNAYEAHEKDPNSPDKFEEVKIRPIFHLAEIYKRLGIPMVGMTANQRDFARAIVKYLGLSELFIECATDEDMTGGGKDVAMSYLIGKLEAKGIPVPKDRLVVVGDSIRGDVGSAKKFSESGVPRPKGILVMKDKQAIEVVKEQISKDPKLQEILNLVNTQALSIKDVPISSVTGKPILASGQRGKFLEELK